MNTSPLKRRLLLVDDNAINLAILTKILMHEYEISTAKNGKEALKILKEDLTPPVSAVILDLVMPVMDGYEVLRRMRGDEELAPIPVIVASGVESDDHDNSEVLALSLGANDYVTKPYKPEIIKHRIANTIYLRETASFINTVQHDSLTGLYSKEYFYVRAEQILKSKPNRKYDLICGDIERFKLVNDLYGTQTGDKLLKNCADIFKSLVGRHGLVARIGPDVFAFFVRHSKKYTNEQFEAVNELINSGGINMHISLRFGVYVVDDTTIPISLMCDRACLAKEAAKGKYDTYFKFYDENIRQKLVNEQYISSNMKRALEQNQFEVYFQPKYELRSEKIVGTEALVRWNNPERGFMSPGEFIPLFEKNGFITNLDIFVWESCCKMLRSWLDRGNEAIPVSVNVSRADIYNPNLDKIILSLIKKYRLSPKFLHLEITESAYTENSQQLVMTVEKLKKLGFVIEMDDFGTGYSSLNMLSELPIDTVKLDVGFMQNQKKYNSRSVLSFVISLAKWMGFDVTAEGVETVEHVNLMRSLGCQYAQGFYYARPMPVADFEQLLLKQTNESREKMPDTANRTAEDTNEVFHIDTMLVMDDVGDDYNKLEELFSEEYCVINIRDEAAAVAAIRQNATGIVAVLYVVNNAQDNDGLLPMVDCCNQYEIPIMAIIQGSETAAARMAQTGVSDCILKPYVDRHIKNRIGNAIGSARMSRFEQENEINSTIIEMKKRAEHDSLTGLLNRAEFENRVQDFFLDNDTPDGVFIMLDVDNFKQINDNCGHSAGDTALQSMASTLNYVFPETDIIGRMGGDEFALFVPYALENSDLTMKIRKICHTLDFNVESMPVSCSAGICLSPRDGLDFQTLYENSDIALLCAKRNGKSQFRFYEDGMEKPINEQVARHAEMLLDATSDATFVCDAHSSEIIYINDTACRLLNKKRSACLGARCYQLFWERCRNCDRCQSIDSCSECFYEEDTVMKDGKTHIHIKAKLDEWDGRRVKIHYLQIKD